MADLVERVLKSLHGVVQGFDLNCDRWLDDAWPSPGLHAVCHEDKHMLPFLIMFYPDELGEL